MTTHGSHPAGLALAGLFVGLGLAAAGWFASQTVLTARTGANTATVKGLSERQVKADRAVWTIEYSETGDNEDALPTMFADLRKTQASIIALLVAEGFAPTNIVANAVDKRVSDFRNREGIVINREFQAIGSITVETAKVDAIAPARLRIADLIVDGLDIQNGSPRYTYGGLNAIKPDMLREATSNARVAAEEFAKNAGVTVGAIKLARQGGFSIRDAGEEFGEFEKIDKDVRVVTTIEFYLTE